MTREIHISVRVDETATVEYDEDEIDDIIEEYGALEAHALQKVSDRILAELAVDFDEKVELTVVE